MRSIRSHSSLWECFVSLFYWNRDIIWVNQCPYVCYYTPWTFHSLYDDGSVYGFFRYDIKCLDNSRTWVNGDRYAYGLRKLKQDLKEDLQNYLSY